MRSSEEPKPIRRCVCGGKTFRELRDQGVCTMEEVEAQGCGVTCLLCRPYLERMLRTGETAFAIAPE